MYLNVGWDFERFVVVFGRKVVEFDSFGIQGKFYGVDEGEVRAAVAVGGFLYLCAGVTGAGCRLSVVERQTKKVVYYAELETAIEHMIMSRKRNLLITYDDKHRLSFWRPN